jgi:menaquinone-9 beta-reductase
MWHLTIPERFDCEVLVAGAGPAGASTAAHLAAAGIHTVLLDAQHFPRDKVCGDFVGPAAIRELHKLGITSQAGDRGTNVIREASLHLDGRCLITHPMPQVGDLPPHGRVIPRLTLDAWILDAARRAGALVQEGARVQDFEADADGVRVTVKDAGNVTRRLRTRAGRRRRQRLDRGQAAAPREFSGR